MCCPNFAFHLIFFFVFTMISVHIAHLLNNNDCNFIFDDQYKLGYNNSLVNTNKIYFTYFIAHHRLTTITKLKASIIIQTQPKKLYICVNENHFFFHVSNDFFLTKANVTIRLFFAKQTEKKYPAIYLCICMYIRAQRSHPPKYRASKPTTLNLSSSMRLNDSALCCKCEETETVIHFIAVHTVELQILQAWFIYVVFM